MQNNANNEKPTVTRRLMDIVPLLIALADKCKPAHLFVFVSNELRYAPLSIPQLVYSTDCPRKPQAKISRIEPPGDVVDFRAPFLSGRQHGHSSINSAAFQVESIGDTCIRFDAKNRALA